MVVVLPCMIQIHCQQSEMQAEDCSHTELGLMVYVHIALYPLLYSWQL